MNIDFDRGYDVGLATRESVFQLRETLGTCWLCGTLSPVHTLILRHGYRICTACADTTTRLEDENAQLRARCQAAESALHLLLDAAEDALPQVILMDDAACMRLLEVVRAVNQGLAEPLACVQCHRALEAVQHLDHVRSGGAAYCVPCWERMGSGATLGHA